MLYFSISRIYKQGHVWSKRFKSEVSRIFITRSLLFMTSIVWWTLYTSDIWLSNTLGYPYMIPHREDVPFPMEELEFLNLSRIASGPCSLSASHTSSSSLSSKTSQIITLSSVAVNSTAAQIGTSKSAVPESQILEDENWKTWLTLSDDSELSESNDYQLAHNEDKDLSLTAGLQCSFQSQ